MDKKNLWIIGIIVGILLIVISYLGYSVFDKGINDCGHGEKWPLFIKSILTVCLPTVIPHPITKPSLYLGVIILVVSIIALSKVRSKKQESLSPAVPPKT